MDCKCAPDKRRLRLEKFTFPMEKDHAHHTSFPANKINCKNCGFHYRWINPVAVQAFLKGNAPQFY